MPSSGSLFILQLLLLDIFDTIIGTFQCILLGVCSRLQPRDSNPMGERSIMQPFLLDIFHTISGTF